MNSSYTFSRNQLLSLSAVTVLSPALRLFPSAASESAGGAAWLSALIAFPPVFALLWLLCRYMERREDGEGLAPLMLRAGGPVLGRAFLAVTALWLLLYAGFSLMVGANRLITTVYPNADPVFFEVVLGIMGLTSAAGSFRTMARFAKLIAPLLFGALILVLVFGAFSLDSSNLRAITVYELPNIALGALPAVDIVIFALYGVCFAEARVKKEPGRLLAFSVLAALMLTLLFLLAVVIIGNFGAELTARLTRPFFSLVRNLVFFGSIERVEALVVSLWVFPDFLLSSCVLCAAQQCIRLLFGMEAEYAGEGLFNMKNGRYIIWLCAAAAVGCAALMGRTPEGLLRWSLLIIPIINMSYAFLFLPVTYAAGLIGKRI